MNNARKGISFNYTPKPILEDLDILHSLKSLIRSKIIVDQDDKCVNIYNQSTVNINMNDMGLIDFNPSRFVSIQKIYKNNVSLPYASILDKSGMIIKE